jgi:predicted nucleic-acid-binding Zn-ribbon protein
MAYKKQWKCGNCGKEYTFEDFIRLTTVKAVESDVDGREYGFVGRCECGYRFHIDTWRLHDKVEIGTDQGAVNIMVSTVFLEFNHGYDESRNIWYETMIFPGGFGDDEIEWLKSSLVHRYETKENAIKDHDKIVNMLKEGRFKIIDYQWEEGKKELIICDEEK